MTDNSDQPQYAEILARIADAVIYGRAEGSADSVRELTLEAIGEGIEAKTILNDALIPAMDVVTEKREKERFYIPQLLIAGRAMNIGMEILEPYLIKGDYEPKGIYVIGTVKGDMHDIGKNLVSIMLKGNGYKVIDLGVEVSPEKFVKAIQENEPQIVGLSALLSTTMPAMRTTIKAIEDATIEGTRLRDKVKIMIGGAPVTEADVKKYGADGYAENAGLAVKVANSLLPQ